MKIIITESQYNLLFENKSVDAAQTLIDMAVDDYIESCGKMKAFTNIQLALCKGLKNNTVKLEVTKVSDFNIDDQKNFRIHLNLFVNQEWMLEDSYYESFENTLAIKISNILGILKYFCYIDDIKMIDNNKDNLTEEQPSYIQETFRRDRFDSEYADEYPKYKDMLITAIKMEITASGKSETSIMLGNSNGDVSIYFKIGGKTLYYDYNWADDIEKLIPWHIYTRHFKYALADYFSGIFPDVIIKNVTGSNIALY
jgi:hypothetical protein